MTKMTNRNIFRQSNLLINAKYKMSSVSLDVFFMLLTEINSKDEDIQMFKFKISDIENRINKRLDRRYLEKISDELTGYNLKISTENGGFLKANMLSSFEYIKNKGIIELEISKKMEPYVLRLKENFTKSSLEDITSMQSEYSKRLYLLFDQRKNLKTWKVDLEELQDILCVGNSLRPFGAFNREVLKIALRDINKSSSLRVELLPLIKVGRSVVSLKFKITKLRKINNEDDKNKEAWEKACSGELFEEERGEFIDVCVCD